MSFTQLIELGGVEDETALRDHLAAWDDQEAGDAPGYLGARLLRDLDGAGRYLIAVDFSSAEEAERNSDRPETDRWAKGLDALGATRYVNLGEVYRSPR